MFFFRFVATYSQKQGFFLGLSGFYLNKIGILSQKLKFIRSFLLILLSYDI